MANHSDELDRVAADIRRRSDEMLRNLVGQRDDLRELQKRMTPQQFKGWALNELGMDDATLRDFLAFDGTTDGVTEPIQRYFMNIITGGKTS